MNGYALKTDVEIDKSKELFAKLAPFFEQCYDGVADNFFQQVEQLLTELKKEWDTGNLIISLADDLERVVNYRIITYALGSTFAELNAPDYSLIRDALITIGAESSTGKSSFLSALALEILKHNQDTAFIFYSLDDSIYLTGKRILSQITGKNQFHVSFDKGTLTPENINLLGRIVLRDQFNIHTFEWEALKAKEVCNSRKIIVGIDYLQVIPNTTEMLQREFFNWIMKELKETHKRLESNGCILFLLSQFNRDKKSGGYRYRETSEIENQSDVCIDIHASDDSQDASRKIKVQKNKLGRKGRELTTEINDAFLFTPLRGCTVEKVERSQENKSYHPGDLR